MQVTTQIIITTPGPVTVADETITIDSTATLTKETLAKAIKVALNNVIDDAAEGV